MAITSFAYAQNDTDNTPPTDTTASGLEKIRISEEDNKSVKTQSASTDFSDKEADETPIKQKKIKKKPDQPFLKRVFQPEEHNPTTATAFSLLLPGAGQFYNKKYWKLPIVYGGLGGMSYLVYRNTKDHRLVRNAYLARVDDDPLTIDTLFTDRYSDAALNSIRLSTKKSQELAIIGLGIVYTLVAVDAFVDAHMINFNVDDDLSLGISPTLINTGQRPVVGLSLALRAKKPKTTPLLFR